MPDPFLGLCQWRPKSHPRTPAQAAVVRCRLHPLPVGADCCGQRLTTPCADASSSEGDVPAGFSSAEKLIKSPDSGTNVWGEGFTIPCPWNSENVTSAGQGSVMFGPVARSTA
ncbi:unnamed protein product [Staurois parvus]|uniref:Uncharacterized protein n=1 Tax=Staurois parvus TaxID=386267 RepID=A0ABN9FF04_9NEOB|nr:unnamed protein product [Staurois parvus]